MRTLVSCQANLFVSSSTGVKLNAHSNRFDGYGSLEKVYSLCPGHPRLLPLPAPPPPPPLPPPHRPAIPCNILFVPPILVCKYRSYKYKKNIHSVGKTVDSFKLEIEINILKKIQNLSLEEKRHILKLCMFFAIHKTFNRTNYGKYSTRENKIKIWNEIRQRLSNALHL